jgi:uncharacterized protein YndB with AHSA1/START domain
MEKTNMSKTNFVVDRERLEVRISRIFKASAKHLFKASTDPIEIPKWWGPGYLTTTVDKLDLRVGGVWRFIQKDAKGKEFIFNGIYKEIDAPNKLVYTFEYEAIPGHILEETVTFTEQPGGTTKLNIVSRYTDVADLVGMINMDMEGGVVEGHERLAKLVERA